MQGVGLPSSRSPRERQKSARRHVGHNRSALMKRPRAKGEAQQNDEATAVDTDSRDGRLEFEEGESPAIAPARGRQSPAEPLLYAVCSVQTTATTCAASMAACSRTNTKGRACSPIWVRALTQNSKIINLRMIIK